MPFRYQGKYYDSEIELAYNRFRYYDPEDGRYISQDPIGLASGEPNFYAYVADTNLWIDPFGLECGKAKPKKTQVHHIIPNAVYRNFRKQLRDIKGYVQAKHKNAINRSNLIELDTPFHGNHPKYNDFVEIELTKLKNSSEGLTFDNVYKLQNEMRDLIKVAQESGKTLNDFFAGLVP